jgi:uncharacterized protein YlzI (FlbEa/FlbD family)
MKEISVTKMNGEKEVYNPEKIAHSLRNSGADKDSIEIILKEVEKILYDGIKTKILFAFVFERLKKIEKGSSARYNLKQGMIALGVDGGLAFEKFMARVLEKTGYKTELNQKIRGKFISHEIDVVAKNKKECMMVEAKHFSKPWLGMQIQTALYVYARFLDVRKDFNSVMLATNTKFSPQVIDYSEGVGIKLMGWKYPNENSLEKVIKKYKIYPITILSLPKGKIRRYLEKNIIVFEDLLRQKNLQPGLREEMIKILND